MMRKWMYGVLVGVIFVLAACGGGKDEASPAASAPSAQEAIANPPQWTVKAGEAFEINLDNQGGLQHNWAIVKQGVEAPMPFDSTKDADMLLWDAGLVDPGQNESGRFTVTDPGIYTVICTVSGHYPSMQGKLVVE